MAPLHLAVILLSVLSFYQVIGQEIVIDCPLNRWVKLGNVSRCICDKKNDHCPGQAKCSAMICEHVKPEPRCKLGWKYQDGKCTCNSNDDCWTVKCDPDWSCHEPFHAYKLGPNKCRKQKDCKFFQQCISYQCYFIVWKIIVYVVLPVVLLPLFIAILISVCCSCYLSRRQRKFSTYVKGNDKTNKDASKKSKSSWWRPSKKLEAPKSAASNSTSDSSEIKTVIIPDGAKIINADNKSQSDNLDQRSELNLNNQV